MFCELKVAGKARGGQIEQQERTQITSLTARHAMPTLFWESTSVQAGALTSYGGNFQHDFRQVGI
jgi:hypothetical protein